MRQIFGTKWKTRLASLGFYAYWRVDYLPILLGSIVVNFAIASAIQIQVERSGSRQKLTYSLLFIGIAFNLGLLGYFKYFDFLIETTNATIGSQISTFDLVLPLAISFLLFSKSLI